MKQTLPHKLTVLHTTYTARMALFDNSTISPDNHSSWTVEEVCTEQSIVVTILTVKYYVSLIRSYCLLPIGLIGSVLTLLVICRTTTGPKSFTYCVCLIAVSDGLHLGFTYFNVIATLLLWPRPRWFCKMAYFMNYSTSTISDNMVMILAIERAVAVVIPHKVKMIFTVKRVLFILLLIIVYSFLLNTHTLFTIDTNGHGGCTSVVEYIQISQIFNLIIIVNLLLCFIIILACAVVITYKLRQRRITMAANQIGTTNNDTQITVMLLAMSLLYLVATLPFLAIWIYSSFMSKIDIGSAQGKSAVLVLATQTALVLKDLGHVGNFYLYCLSAKIFRKAFLDLVISFLSKWWKCRNSSIWLNGN